MTRIIDRRAALLLPALILLALAAALPLSSRAQSQPATCDLHFRWSLCAYSGPSGMPVDVAFGGAQGRITAIYAWVSAEQRWDAHFPSAVGIPGANDFDTLTSGRAYFVAITAGPSVTWEQPTDIPPPTPTRTATSTPTATATPGVSEFVVHYIDVGQGDATLITAGGERMLIDGGRSQERIEERLNALGITNIDIIVETHPDADHVAGLIRVLELYDVDEIYLSGGTSTSQTYDTFMAAVNSEGATVATVSRGDTIALGGLELDVYHPAGITGDSNADSVVLSLTCGTVDVLLMGDATTASEASMLGAGLLSQTTVLKVGHHGSDTSTGQAFVNIVRPDYAVISAGMNSQYGHPHDEVVSRLTAIGATLYHTDTTTGDDTIRMSSDCETVSFDTNPWTPGTSPATATPTTRPATATPTARPATATPTRVPPTSTPPSSQGPWYTSAHHSAQYYYCAADTWGWQGLSPSNLRQYATEAALLAVWEGERVKHPNSAC